MIIVTVILYIAYGRDNGTIFLPPSSPMYPPALLPLFISIPSPPITECLCYPHTSYNHSTHPCSTRWLMSPHYLCYRCEGRIRVEACPRRRFPTPYHVPHALQVRTVLTLSLICCTILHHEFNQFIQLIYFYLFLLPFLFFPSSSHHTGSFFGTNLFLSSFFFFLNTVYS